LKGAQSDSGRRAGIFSDDRFIYDKDSDTYICPASKGLKPRTFQRRRQSIEYAASKKDCGVCVLRTECTRSKTVRTVKRHLRQEELDYMRALAGSTLSKDDIKTRQHLMERSFERAKRYGFGRARWRGLWRVRIQEYLTAAIQNIQILLRYGTDPRKLVAAAKIKDRINRDELSFSEIFKEFLFDPILKLRAVVDPCLARGTD